jgi:phosphatidylglycerol:prolipoprotein diacylglycerol transferase
VGEAAIEIPFDPRLTLGPVTTSWHAVMTLAGVVVATAIAARVGLREALLRGYGSRALDIVWSVALACVAGGFIGSRIFYVLDHLTDFTAHPLEIFAIASGGASIVGGIIGGIILGVGFLAIRRLPIGVGVDAAGLALPVGMAIGRIGDLINGEHWSIACSGVPWCVRYTHPDTFGQRDFVHPTVGYELLLDLVIALILYALYVRAGRRLGSGRLLFTFLALYGAVRFFDTFFRIDAPVYGGLALAQWMALLFVLAGVVGLAVVARQARPYPES